MVFTRSSSQRAESFAQAKKLRGSPLDEILKKYGEGSKKLETGVVSLET